MIIRYPKAIKAGSASNAIAMNIDFAPTFLDFAGVEIPEDIQGVSLKTGSYQLKVMSLPIGGKLHIIITMSILPNIR